MTCTTRRSAGRLLVGLTSAAVLAGCAGGTIASERPSASATPAGVVPTASVAGTSPPASAIPALAWQIGSIPSMFEGNRAYPVAVALGSDGLAAVGGRAFRDNDTPSGGTASAWHSGDGLVWEPAVADNLAVGDEIRIDDSPAPGLIDVAWGPAGYVAVGIALTSNDREGGAWISTDGRTWTRTKLPDPGRARPAAVTWNGTTYVIVGVVNGDTAPRAAAWLSTDGSSWHRVADGDAFDVGGYITMPAAISSGGPADVTKWRDGSLVAVGSTCTGTTSMEQQPVCWPLVMRSTDSGETWTRIAGPDAAGVTLSSVAVTEGGFLAAGPGTVGEDGPHRVVIGDEAGWRLVELSGAPRFDRVATFASAYLGLSSANNVLSLWASRDGEAWTQLAALPQPPDVTVFGDVDLAAAGSRVVVVGNAELESAAGQGAFSIVGTP